MTKNNGIRYCKTCCNKLRKNGYTSKGTRRWRCLKCGKSMVLKRTDVRNKNIGVGVRNSLIAKEPTNTISLRRGTSRATEARKRQLCIRQGIVLPPITGEVYDWIMIDATWLAHSAVGIVRARKHVVYWEFHPKEGLSMWLSILSKMPRPSCVVCDGQKGMLEAIRRLWGEDMVIQRCHFHIMQNMRRGLPYSSKEPAVQDMLYIRNLIGLIHYPDQKQDFIDIFNETYGKHREFVDEHTMKPCPTGQLFPKYKHAKLHTVYVQMQELIANDNIFTFITYPGLNIPNTTNLLEGGINSAISELLLVHRGLNYEGQCYLINEYLWSKTEFCQPPRKPTIEH